MLYKNTWNLLCANKWVLAHLKMILLINYSLTPGVKSQVESYQRLKKMVLDASLPNTQH